MRQHCDVCNVRMIYVPKQGAPSSSTQTMNHAMVHAQRASTADAQIQANSSHLQGHDGQDHSGDSAPKPDHQCLQAPCAGGTKFQSALQKPRRSWADNQQRPVPTAGKSLWGMIWQRLSRLRWPRASTNEIYVFVEPFCEACQLH